MQLLNNFYHITQQSGTGREIRFKIAFHPDHIIYKAHFPQQPVTPGVCTLQTVTELAELVLQRSLRVVGIKNAKFLALLTPIDVPEVFIDLNIKEEAAAACHIKAEVSTEQQVYAKLSILYA